VISGAAGSDGRDWRVSVTGAAYWFARGASEPVVARHGAVLRLPA